jgi:hypothetical protein
VALTLYFALFRLDLLINQTTNQTTVGPLSFDLFSAVVFIIAGPAIGLTLFVFQRIIYELISRLQKEEKKKMRNKFIEDYAKIRIYCNAEEKSELEQNELLLDFCNSTGIALIAIDIYYILKNFNIDNIEIKASILIVGLVLLIGKSYFVNRSYSSLINHLLRKYKDKIT